MAKVKSAETTVEQIEGAPTPAVKTEKAPKAPRVSNIHYTFVKEPAEGQKFAPQANLIVKHIQNAGAAGISKTDLCKALDGDEAFKTKQPTERIVGYYQKDLVNAGVISQTGAPAEA